MRLIDADELMNTLQNFFDKREKDQIFSGNRGTCVSWNDAIYFIKTAPTVDAVRVTRCEDCVPIICPMRNVNKSDKAYCSFGSPRE